MTIEQYEKAEDIVADIKNAEYHINYFERIAELLCQRTKSVKIEFTYFPDSEKGVGKIEKTELNNDDDIAGKENSLVTIYLRKIHAYKAKRDELYKELEAI